MEFSCSTSLISRMLEASSNSLIALYFLTIIIQMINAQYRSPTCSYFGENSGLISNESSLSSFINNLNVYCVVLKESDYCLSYSEFMNLEMNISEVEETYVSKNNRYAYVNVTVDYNWGPHSNRFLLQESDVGTCWNVRILGDEYPSHVIVSDIPVSLNFSGLTAAAVLSESHGPQSCKKSCLALNGLVLNFAAYENKKSVILKIHVEEDSEYRLELLSGKCNISCNGETNQCNVKIRNEILHLNAREGQELRFSNLTPAFYCARIGTLDNCCVIHTATDWLNEVSEIDVVVVVDPLAHYAIGAVVFGIILTSSFFFVVTRTMFCPLGFFSREETSNEPEREYDVSLITETDFQQLIAEIKDSIQVYLVYNYDSEEFLDLMASFRQLLSRFVKKVWDPYSDEDFEDVSSNSSKWVQTVLANPNIRIILVETEEAVAREKMWIEGQEEQPSEFQHCLHNVFLFTLSLMINDFQKFFDYTRTFIIRIEPSIDSNFTFQSCTRYHLPDNVEKLIFDLSRQITKRSNIDFADFSKLTVGLKEKEDFVNEYMKFNQVEQQITQENL